MLNRVNRYYQFPASKELVNHMRDEIGFTRPYRDIFDDLRNCTADTQCHADNCCMPLKQYNMMSATVGRMCVEELIRLAEIGLKSDRM